MTHRPWNNGEYHYITELVRTGGNSNVPRPAVLSYLVLQVAGATRDKEFYIAGIVQEALSIIKRGHLSPKAFNEAFALLMTP